MKCGFISISVYTLVLRIPKRPLLHGGFVILSYCHTRRTLHDGTDAIFCNSSNDQTRASVGRRQQSSLPPACACLRSYMIFFLAFSSFSCSFLLVLLPLTSPLHHLRGRSSFLRRASIVPGASAGDRTSTPVYHAFVYLSVSLSAPLI